MAWETEFTSTTPGKHPKRVEYQTNALKHHSRAERPDRVKVSGKVVHKGWASDQRGFALYKSLTTEWYATEERGIHDPLCPNRTFHSNPAHVCDPDKLTDSEWERENDLYNRYDRIGKARPSGTDDPEDAKWEVENL